jgi:hypothetical protein
MEGRMASAPGSASPQRLAAANTPHKQQNISSVNVIAEDDGLINSYLGMTAAGADSGHASRTDSTRQDAALNNSDCDSKCEGGDKTAPGCDLESIDAGERDGQGPKGMAGLWRVVRPGGVVVRAGPGDGENVVCEARCGDVLEVVSGYDGHGSAAWLRLREVWTWKAQERLWCRAAAAWVRCYGGNESAAIERIRRWEAAQVGRRGRGLWKVAPGGVDVLDGPSGKPVRGADGIATNARAKRA